MAMCYEIESDTRVRARSLARLPNEKPFKLIHSYPNCMPSSNKISVCLGVCRKEDEKEEEKIGRKWRNHFAPKKSKTMVMAEKKTDEKKEVKLSHYALLDFRLNPKTEIGSLLTHFNIKISFISEVK